MASHRLQLRHQTGDENPGWFWRVVADDFDPADETGGLGPYAERDDALRTGQAELDAVLAMHAATPNPEAVWHDVVPSSEDDSVPESAAS